MIDNADKRLLDDVLSEVRSTEPELLGLCERIDSLENSNVPSLNVRTIARLLHGSYSALSAAREQIDLLVQKWPTEVD